MFVRKATSNLDGLEGSGADWLGRFKPYMGLAFPAPQKAS
jgi:hypothetical protein